MKSTCLALVLVGTAASAAFAGVINVSDIGGGIVLNSGPLSQVLLGPGQTNWTTPSLTAVHQSLNSSGVATNGKVSILAADTDRGLALIVLIDQMLNPGTAAPAFVHMDSIANGANLAFLMDTNGDVAVSGLSTNSRIASGDFSWNSNGAGDAFAWAGMIPGNSTTFRFNQLDDEVLGLNDPGTFQFVNWNGLSWNIVAVPTGLVSFSESGDFGFAASVVPAPSAIALLGGPVLGLCFGRRRRAR